MKKPFAITLDVGSSLANRTGSWRYLRPKYQSKVAPCGQGCPAGNDVQAFINAVGRKDFDEAIEVLLRTSPLPAVCGRVCPAPCIEGCNRADFDQSVNVREIERAAAELGTRPEPTSPWREDNVAVVGSGPAGLSTAYHMARLGYPVTMFEADDELGGVLRTGIPTYRLPRDVLRLIALSQSLQDRGAGQGRLTSLNPASAA